MTRKRILVVGAGPAGLAAGIRLLEAGRGRVDVRLVHMGHHVGGKAALYTDAQGRRTEHGWHMVLGFYERMRDLMRRAGIDEPRVLSSMAGRANPYEPWSGRIHTLSGSGGALAFAARFAGYDGLPLDDRIHYSRFMTETFALACSGEDLRRHDDVCFSTWALEHGLPPHIVPYSLFRMFRDLYFNFPEQVSAYHVLQTMKLTSSSEAAEAFVCRGSWSEMILGAHREALRRPGRHRGALRDGHRLDSTRGDASPACAWPGPTARDTRSARARGRRRSCPSRRARSAPWATSTRSSRPSRTPCSSR